MKISVRPRSARAALHLPGPATLADRPQRTGRRAVLVAVVAMLVVASGCGGEVPTQEECDRLAQARERDALEASSQLQRILSKALADDRMTARERTRLQDLNDALGADLQPVGCE